MKVILISILALALGTLIGYGLLKLFFEYAAKYETADAKKWLAEHCQMCR